MSLQQLFDKLKSRLAVKKVNNILYFNGQSLTLPDKSQITISKTNTDIK
jgi:hypothetical protein